MAKKLKKKNKDKTEYLSKLVLGNEYRDIKTGWKGYVEVISFHDNGCTRVLMTRVSHDGEKILREAFDEAQLEIPPNAETIDYKSDIKLGDWYRDTMNGIEGYAGILNFFENAEERVSLFRSEQTAFGVKMRSPEFDASKVEHMETGQVPVTTQGGGPDRGTAALLSGAR